MSHSIKGKKAESKRPASNVNWFKRDWQKYAMLLLPMLFVLVFCYIPMYGVVIAFQDYNIMKGVFGSQWVGLENFIYAFSLPRFMRVLKNTLVLNMMGLILGFPMPILFALFISELKNAKIVKTIQTVSYLPHFLSTVIIGGLVSQLCAPDVGIFNLIIKSITGENFPFLTSNVPWMFTYVISGIWQAIGWDSIIYIAGILGINPELYEAATVDGAGRFQRIWHVTLPGIKPLIVLMLILSMGDIISIGFDKPYVFGNPMVSDVSEVISIFVYNVGLGQGNYSLATVVGLFQSVVGAIMVLTVNRIAKAMGEQGI